jgi:hypothetical protein
MTKITVYMRNDDPFSNHVKAWDRNDSDSNIFDGNIDAHSREALQVIQNDSGFANVATSTDDNPIVGHSMLHDGDEFDI